MTRATSGTPVARRQRAESTPCLDAYRQHGNVAAASKALHMRRATYCERLAAERAASASPQVAPKPKAAPRRASQVTGGPDLTAAVAALVAAQDRQGKLLERLLSGKDESRAPRKAEPEPESKHEKPVAGGCIPPPVPARLAGGRRRFVVTSAQNNTHVHPCLMAALRTYAAEHRSEILISRFSYNKDGWGQSHNATKDEDGLWYDPAILPHVCDESVELAPGLVFCGELDILPTAVDPLSGFDSYTKSASAIVPHAKMAMKSMATMKSDPARFLYTTGTVTQRNYIERKAGQKASFHHVFGALAVEVDPDGAWFVRQLIANDDGHFCDLDRLYTPEGSTRVRTEAVGWGDFHEEKEDPVVAAACFDGEGSIISVLDPREQHVNDLADFAPRNHHNLSDPFFMATMLARGTDRVEDGIARCAAKLERIQRDGCRTVVVESNHDQALRRWLREADGHRDAPNARYWHYLNWKAFAEIEKGGDLFVFEAAVREKLASDLPGLTFLREDDSWIVCRDQGGIQCALHGHRGPNGSRGSPKSFRQLGVRANTAHTHSAGIVDGIYTAGVSGLLDMSYNQGPSSWSHSHVVTYANGKRAIVTQRGARWRGMPVEKPRVRVRAGSAANDDTAGARAAA